MDTELTDKQQELQDLLSHITIEGWIKYERHFKCGTQEIMESVPRTLVVAATEKTVREDRVFDPSRFMKMNMNELNDYLGLSDDESAE